MDFYTIFEQGVITTRNCNRHTQGPLDLLLSESFSESRTHDLTHDDSRSTSIMMPEARASVACNVFATRNIPVLAT